MLVREDHGGSDQERGILLERKGEIGIILCPDGSFRRVKAVGPCPIGTEGSFEAVDEPSGHLQQRSLWRKWMAYSLGAACLLMLLAISWLKHGPLTEVPTTNPVATVIAYATVDINPSLEFGIDVAGRVQSARGLDQDGSLLLQSIEYRDQDLVAVTTKVLEQAAAKGYLPRTRKGLVLVTVTPCSQDASVLKLLDPKVLVLKEAVQATTTRLGLQAEVGVVYLDSKAGPKLRDKANELRSSPGRVAFILQLEAEGKAVHINKSATEPIQKIVEEAGVQIGQAVRRMESRSGEEWEQLLVQLAPKETDERVPEPQKERILSPEPKKHLDTLFHGNDQGQNGERALEDRDGTANKKKSNQERKENARASTPKK